VICRADFGPGYSGGRRAIFLFSGEVLSGGCFRNNPRDNTASVLPASEALHSEW